MRTVPELLPTTMVGSYPRPRWFTYPLDRRDALEAFKSFPHTEAYAGATCSALKAQERAGLDILTDGQMWFDDYHMRAKLASLVEGARLVREELPGERA